MSHIDRCPACGERSLVAVCNATVEYTLTNEIGGQSWNRIEVDDDTATPLVIRCDSCGAEYPEFALDSDGYLVSLASTSPVAPSDGEMTAQQFREWLAARIDEWCLQHHLTPGGEGENLGDLYREMDATDAFHETGATLVPAYEAQTLYIVGPDLMWVATTDITLGSEGQTVWIDPLASLRMDEETAEMREERDDCLRCIREIHGRPE